MKEKKIISVKDVKEMMDIDGDTIPYSNIDELADAIRGDGNAKRYLRKFLASDSGIRDQIQDLFKDSEDRINYLRENYYIEGTESDMIDESVSFNAQTESHFISDFEKIVSEMENEGYKKINPESDDVFSSVEVKLTENNVIENGCLKVTWRGEERLNTSKAFIMEKDGNRVLAFGKLYPVENTSNRFWAIFDDRTHIFYDRFEEQNQVRIVVFTGSTPHSCVAEMNYAKMGIEAEKPLCIDFGTSNTTAGSYGIKTPNDIEVVKFVDVTVTPHNTDVCMLPTVIYVEDCADPNNIKYLFGYEALKKIEQEEHYEFKSSAFFEIKRWMTNPASMEEIKDKNNNKVKIERRFIIKAYIDYVIELSEQFFGKRFNNIHFSAPVKLKSLFINTFKELYHGKKVILGEKDSIDEAFAIVYNQIINIIYGEKKNIDNKNVLIMDCGGGTTDLANCTFSYKRNADYTDDLTYTTRFENGNANFGGNNITYRVMQLLKIKIAANFDSSIEKNAMYLIDKTEDEILGIIEDKNNTAEAYNSDQCSNSIYERFVDEYQKCESIIPTMFSKELELDSYELKCRKRNFYCMWRLAEKIKIEFFNTIKVQFDFCDSEIKELLVDSTNDYFYVNQNDKLDKRNNPLKNVTITNKDVERIICGDIYGLLYGLMKNGDLSDDSENPRNVENFDYYKLSGQSCKISMFKELLKEYIPGRKLRPHSNTVKESDKTSESLKLECLLGCIRYIKDKRGHELNIVADIVRPKIIYNIYIKNDYGTDERIFDCEHIEPEKTIFKVFNQNANEMFFAVKNRDEAVEKEFRMGLDDVNELDAGSIVKLAETITDNYAFDEEYIKKVLDSMGDKTVSKDEITKILFCVPSPDYYGTTLFLIQHEVSDNKHLYKLLYSMDVSFENPDKTFFDGKR